MSGSSLPTLSEAGADTLYGEVVSEPDGEPVEGALVRILEDEAERGVRSDSLGRFVFLDVPGGSYSLRVEADGFETARLTVTVPEDRSGRVDVWLTPLEVADAGDDARQEATVVGRVVDASTGEPLVDVAVRIEGTGLGVFTDSAGRYRLTGVPPGPRVLRAERIGYASYRSRLDLSPGERAVRSIRLAVSALEMEEIDVTADAVGRAEGELGTATVIGEEAIKNQTATSLQGVLEMVPGVPVSAPGLGNVQQFSLRSVPAPGAFPGAGSLIQGVSPAQLAAFGTSIVVDGVPLSNNANLQTLSGRAGGTAGLSSSAGGGIDLRRIPASMLERVEVIRGIPSVRWGDLTQGAVIVYTKAGRVGPDLVGHYDARTSEGASVAGMELGDGQVATASVDVARSFVVPGLRDELDTRVTGQLAHRLETGEGPEGGPALRLDTRLDFFRLYQEVTVEETFEGRARWSRDRGIRLSERARLSLGEESALSFTGAFSHLEQDNFRQTIQSRGAIPFTDRLTEGRQEGHYVGGSYLSKFRIEGGPSYLFTRTEYEHGFDLLGLGHELRAGAVLRREWNSGPGYQFDMETPPQSDFNGVQGFDRPRSFDPIPPLTASALYLDDRVSRTFSDGVRLTAQGGLRLDVLHEGSWWTSGARDVVLQPRLNLEFQPAEGIRLRAGAGRTAKLPALSDLYPAPQYYDVVNVNHFIQDPAERLAVLTTFIEDPTNPDLGFSTGEKLEAGLELDLGRDAHLSLVAFQDRIEGGVGTEFRPTSLLREHFALTDTVTGDGEPPEYVTPATLADTVPVMIHRPANVLELQNRGLEVTAFLPEIEPIQTRFEVQGAWIETDFSKDGLDFGTSSLWSDFQTDEDQPRSPYWEAPRGSGTRAILTYRAIHHQPELGLVVTATVQHYPKETRRTVASTDTLAFRGYITRSGELVPVPPSERSDPRFSDLRRTRSGLLVDPERVPADWILSFRASKTLPLDGRLTFFAFNSLYREGKESERGFARRTFPPVQFGLEVRMPLRSVFR